MKENHHKGGTGGGGNGKWAYDAIAQRAGRILRPAEGGGLKLRWGAPACTLRGHRGGSRPMKQVEPGAEPKPPPRTQGGWFSPNEASVHKGGEKYPPHRKRGGRQNIYIRSQHTVGNSERARPHAEGGGYNQTKPVYPRARIIAPQKEGGGDCYPR